MSLQKQLIDLAFAQGIDTKVDPNRVEAGKLLVAENITFTTGMEFNKRAGGDLLGSLDAGVNLANYQGELVAFDGTNLSSYSPSTETFIDKGEIPGLELEITSVYQTSTAQTNQDSAYHLSGMYLYCWTDSVNGAQYVVVSASTGNQVITATNLPANSIAPKAFALGNYLIVTFINDSTNRLSYIAIPVFTLVPQAAVEVTTLIDPTNKQYDGVVYSNTLYLAYNASDAAGAIRITTINQYLTASTAVAKAGEESVNCLGIFVDSALSQVWVAYFDGNDIRYFVVAATSLSPILAPTTAVTGVSNILNINGYAASGIGQLFYQTQNTYSYSSVRTDFVSEVNVTNAGVVSGNAVLLRSVGLISKVFAYNGNYYFVTAYSGALQPTYFVVNQNGTIVAKVAYTNGGGYAGTGLLTNINEISQSQFQFAYLFKSQVSTQQGVVYSQTGVNSSILNFGANNLYNSIDIGSNLNISGGFLWAYDGYGPVEQNFHVFPEDYAYTASSSSSANISANSYSYVPLYEWTDNQGNIHRSGYGNPLPVVLGSPSSGVTVQVPTLRLTAKRNVISPVSITLYRTAPTVATGIYYKVSSISMPTLNDVTIDSVAITDTLPDSAIVGNELLYTTGGVVQNTGAPSAVDTTIYKSRAILIDAENRNTWWYSKQVLQATPVELNDAFTQYADPRYGVLTACEVMDDKLILFKENAIFYVVGNGPDNTGANNDFSDSVFVTSTVGCINPKSVVLTPDGLMFQSNKGIWLLNRGLGVSFIGAEVSAFTEAVTGAVLVPDTTEVRFNLIDDTCLVYDYYYKQWGTYPDFDAAGSVIFDDAYTRITPTGNVLQETGNLYTDNGTPYFISLTTSWISMAGFQGFQRVYELYLKAKFRSPHVLYVSIAYDFNPNPVQVAVIRPTELANLYYGDDPFYGSTEVYGGNSPEQEQYKISLDRQKCESIQITIREALDTDNPVNGAGVILEALGFLIGTKSSYPRLSPNKSVS